MSKFSVKKPFTVLMAVIAALILGFVSLGKMQLDLLPEVSLPYILVITTYPGASAEKVENDVCIPMEGALGTINGVKNIYSICNENYGMVELEFQDDVNLDSVMVKVSSALNSLDSYLPEDCGTPSILEISTDMMASIYLAVSMEGMSIEELSQFVEDEITPQFEKQNGVASISTLGLVDKTIQVELNKDKVDILNEKILATTDDAFADAVEQLDDAKKQLVDSGETIADNKEKLNKSQADLEKSKKDLKENQDKINDSWSDLDESKEELEKNKQAMEDGQNALKAGQEKAYQELANYNYQLEILSQAISEGDAELQSRQDAFENALKDLNTKQAALVGVAEDDPTYATKMAELAAAKTTFDNASEELNNYSTSELDILKRQYAEYEKGKLETYKSISSTDAQLSIGKAQLSSAEAQIESAEKTLKDSQKQIDEGWDSIKDGQETIDDSWESIRKGEGDLRDGWDDYYDAVKDYEKQKAEAIKKANADDLLDLETLAGLIYAQNFEMPAGYVDDELDNSWLIRVGQNYEEVSEVGDIVLCNIHNVGDIKLNDVADISIIDNSEDSYGRLGAEEGVILSVFKASTAGTNDVSKAIRAEIDVLEEEYPGLDILVMVDQGDYINMIVKSVLQSMAIGALLAIIILALFLRDVKPTLVVAISIPLSVLTALICMYFSKISLNMLSLSGLALGIGMLVDNSIVVIENIYRLRGKGIDAPRAAVQGAKQVAGAIVSSTLTTVCVFLPMIYTSGLVRDLMMPMCLTIVYCLLASLLMALTVVPAAGSTILRKSEPKEHKWFDKIQDMYGKALAFCLDRKAIAISVAVLLLGLSGFLVARMGIVVIPDITMNTMEATIKYPDDYDRDTCYELTDQVIDRLLTVDGVATVSVMSGDDTSLMVEAAAENPDNFRTMSFMMSAENEDAGSAEIKEIIKNMEAAVADIDVDFSVDTASSEMDGMMGGSGLSLNVYGDDIEKLTEVTHDIMDIIDGIEGYSNISNGEEDADKIIHLVIDKNKAMSMGLSVAQIYQAINGKTSTSKSAVTVTIDGIEMDIKVVDEMEPLTKENLLDYTFTVDAYDEDDDQITEDHKLGEFATAVVQDGVTTINRENQSRYMTITADVDEGYNITLLTRELEPLLAEYEMPSGYSYDMGGEYDTVIQMVEQMALVILLGLAFIYMIMVAQFQSLLSPFIIIFTIPLAFTGGLLALWLTRENLSVIAIMGFLVLMGTVVNNGIVFVDYINLLRKQGLDRRNALIATGKTRMRPILMTALTTIFAESNLIIGDDMGAQLSRGMALVIAGGLAYATLMTLFIVPIMYDILFKKQPLDVDTGKEDLDDVMDEAEEYMRSLEMSEDVKEGKNEETAADEKAEETAEADKSQDKE